MSSSSVRTASTASGADATHALAAWVRRHGWTMLEGVVVVLLALQAARLTWLLVMPPGPVGEPLPPVASAVAQRPVRDPFAPASSGAAVAAPPAGLTLFGVRVAADGGSAILADDAGRQAAHAVGDAVAPGLVLVRVAGDHVVLRGSGGERRLDLASGNAASTAGVPPTVLPSGRPASDAAPAIDPQRLLAETSLRPREAGGRVDGYELIPRGDGALLRAAGLQPGDVLLAVNGNTLDTERLAELEQQLAGGGTTTLTIRRGDATHTITLDPDAP